MSDVRLPEKMDGFLATMVGVSFVPPCGTREPIEDPVGGIWVKAQFMTKWLNLILWPASILLWAFNFLQKFSIDRQDVFFAKFRFLS